jgi:flagellar biosynthesis/type III secretory pathway protein FliH
MSFSNKKIIKKTNKKEEAVHIDEHFATFQDEYIEKTSKKQLEEYQKEIDEYRRLELEKARMEAFEIREKAYKEGLARAKEEALLEARAEMELVVRKEWEEEFEKVKEQYFKANRYLMEQQEKLNAKKMQWLQENENDIVEILITSVEKILAREIYLEKDDIKKMLQESINEVNDKSKTVWVRVNPEVKRKIDAQEWDERKIEWIADPKLSKLDVMIETETEWIDSTLKNKIENLKKIIEEWVKQNDLLDES